MKRTILIALALIVCGAGIATAQGSVINTAHDLSTYITGDAQQVCVFCHTPHGSNTDPNGNGDLVGNAPLWNQEIPTTASYGVYTSPTFQASDAAAIVNTAYSTSLLCMSCHDGTVAPGSLFNEPNGVTVAVPGTIITGGTANLGTSLATHHPVNFTYATSLSQGDTGLVADPPVGYLDGNGMVQCSSCHEPHDQGTTPDLTVNFMQNSLDGSLLCLDCHDK